MPPFQRVRSTFKRFWKIITPGLILAIALPLWQIYLVNTPDVHVEVTQVEKKAADDARLIDYARDDDLRFLSMQIVPSVLIQRTSEPTAAKDVRDVERLLDEYTRDYVTAQRTSLNDQQKRIEDLTPATLTLDLARRLNGPLADEVDLREFQQKRADPQYLAGLVEQFKTKYKDVNKDAEDLLQKSSENAQKAKIRLQAFKDALDRREARIWVNAAVANSGRGAVSLRREGILRVFLGGNNYIDLELLIDKYETHADLTPKTSRIVSLYSDPLKDLKSTDQDRIVSYWGQNVPSRFYLMDIDGKIYESDPFPFAQGLYQQIIYDRLRNVASRRRTTAETPSWH